MPIDNLGKNHFTTQQKQDITSALAQIKSAMSALMVNLTPHERSKYGKVGEQGKLLINSVNDFHQNQPQLQSPDVDWAEFEKDYQDRQFASGILSQLQTIETEMLSIKILRDYDNRNDALLDYKYAQYKNRFANQIGYSTKVEKLKQFFPKTGKTKKSYRQS